MLADFRRGLALRWALLRFRADCLLALVVSGYFDTDGEQEWQGAIDRLYRRTGVRIVLPLDEGDLTLKCDDGTEWVFDEGLLQWRVVV